MKWNHLEEDKDGILGEIPLVFAGLAMSDDTSSNRRIETSWRLLNASFELSAPNLDSCPDPSMPEIAVAGRSNVGKSSLLNAVMSRAGYARVSRTPGRTQLLNFFVLRIQRGSDPALSFRLVDLPGYGFAKAPRSIQIGFESMIAGFLRERPNLRALLALIDARRGPQTLDIQLLEFAAEHHIPCFVCATKVDKLSPSQRGVLAKQFARELDISPRDVLLTSASSGVGIHGDYKQGHLLGELGNIVTRASIGVDVSNTISSG